MTLVVGSVVQLRASRDGGGASHSESAKAGIVWKIEGGEVLWVPIANSRGDGQALHRADIRVTDMGVHTAAGFPVPRPVIECRKLIRSPLAMFEGRPVLGNVPPALMAEIAAMQLREARQLVAETRLENIYQRPNPPTWGALDDRGESTERRMAALGGAPIGGAARKDDLREAA
jgi:hypothetical protein